MGQNIPNCFEELTDLFGLKNWARMGIGMVKNATKGICTKNSSFRDIHNRAKITPNWSDFGVNFHKNHDFSKLTDFIYTIF